MSVRVYTDDEIIAMLCPQREERPLWRRALDKREARSGPHIRCSVCGELGHNKRTCGDVSVRVRHGQKCSRCGELGHNRRSCQGTPLLLQTRSEQLSGGST